MSVALATLPSSVMVLVTQTASETVGAAGVRAVLARDGNSSTTTVLPAMVVPGVATAAWVAQRQLRQVRVRT